MNLKLLAGRLRDAWCEYPGAIREYRKFPLGRPIFLTGTHRSGTTWAAAMLAEPGLWYVHEPFFPRKKLWREAFTYVGPGVVRPDVDALIEDLLLGKHRSASNNPNTDHPLMPLRLLKPPIRRVMIKDPIACLLTNYIAQNFEFDILALFRHPVGFAASVTRLGWPIGGFLKQFLANEFLMTQHLGPHARLLEQYQEQDTLAAAAVLHGSLNLVLWRAVQGNPNIHYRRFEDLCRKPIEAFRDLYVEFQLPYDEATLARHELLCTGELRSAGAYHPHEVSRNSAVMARSWAETMDSATVKRIREIWDSFDVPLYTDSTEWVSGAADHKVSSTGKCIS